MVNGTNVTAGVEIITSVLGNGNVRVTYLQDFGINDSTYGTGAIGWPGGHKFGDLTGSDNLEFRFYDGNGNVAIDFYVDCISAATSAKLSNGTTLRSYPSGYGTLGPFGGDGSMVSGNPSYVVDFSTAMTENLNNALNVPNKAALIVNSPTKLVNGSIVIDTSSPKGAPGGWDVFGAYTVEVSAAAFGSAGFGWLAVPEQHNSPSKIGVNDITTQPTDSTVTSTATAAVTVAGTTLTASANASVAILAHPSSLAGSVYVDANNNGIRDSGEAGIGGVVVTLTGTNTPVPVSKTTTTAPDGSYIFDVLPAGTYRITEDQPSAYDDGKDAAGTAGGTVGPVGTDQISDINLAVNTNATGYTFGETSASTASLSGYVYADTSNNGLKDGSEAGIAGVTVKLLDNSNNLISTVVTTSTGVYSFSGMQPATYRVVETQPSAYLDGIDRVGTIGGTATSDIFTVTVAPGASGSNYNFGEIAASASAVKTASKAFTSTAIALGNTLWFSSVIKMGGLSTAGTQGDVTLRVVNSSITVTTKAAWSITLPRRTRSLRSGAASRTRRRAHPSTPSTIFG